MLKNPYTLSFGMEPSQYIARNKYSEEIISTFSDENPSTHVYMVTGIRGSGKTVFLSGICDSIGESNDWIVINITPDSDVLNSIAAKLYSIKELQVLFAKAKLDFSAFGFGVSIEGGNQIFDIGTALEQMLTYIDKKNKRVLITIDEAVNNTYVKRFSSEFQLLVREKLPVYLIMTGLYKNIYNLQNEDTLTFLYRAPKIVLEPLSLTAISRNYGAMLGVNRETADYMARLTKGYAFAYQVLGYLYFKEIKTGDKTSLDDILPLYEDTLGEYVYEKIWNELSEGEQKIVAIIPDDDYIKVSDVRERLGLKSNTMTVYRDRLNKMGLLDTSKYGHLALRLPMFSSAVRLWV